MRKSVPRADFFHKELLIAGRKLFYTRVLRHILQRFRAKLAKGCIDIICNFFAIDPVFAMTFSYCVSHTIL